MDLTWEKRLQELAWNNNQAIILMVFEVAMSWKMIYGILMNKTKMIQIFR